MEAISILINKLKYNLNLLPLKNEYFIWFCNIRFVAPSYSPFKDVLILRRKLSKYDAISYPFQKRIMKRSLNTKGLKGLQLYHSNPKLIQGINNKVLLHIIILFYTSVYMPLILYLLWINPNFLYYYVFKAALSKH